MGTSFEQAIAEHGPALARIVASYAPPGAEREDLWQEVALAVWRALPRFRAEARLRTYLFRIAHNRGLDLVARRRVRERGRATGVDPDQTPDRAPGPATLAAGQEAEERLVRAVRALPLGQRQVLTLALEGLPHAEIGEVLGLAENAVAVRLSRARKALRGRLVEEGA